MILNDLLKDNVNSKYTSLFMGNTVNVVGKKRKGFYKSIHDISSKLKSQELRRIEQLKDGEYTHFEAMFFPSTAEK